ncbi:MAG TPA: hypothetical protein VFM18_21700 [Methanosarcina sp.]|nr:hypothetical protein [Methanosarcina sp.]
MGYEKTANGVTYNQYGARQTSGGVGIEHGYGSTWVFNIDLTGQSIADAIAGFVPPAYVKNGMMLKSATLRVDEVFVVTGTTPHLEIGSSGSSATNGITITEAQLEALGTYDITSTGVGTWATTSSVAADAKIGFSLEGDTAISATAGKGTVILEFVYKTKI